MGDKQAGLCEKYVVTRTDGSSEPGGKHHGCRYFVLDLTHDPIGRRAARLYALRAREAGYENLADDLERACQECADLDRDTKAMPACMADTMADDIDKTLREMFPGGLPLDHPLARFMKP